jgi:abequosyltransferase
MTKLSICIATYNRSDVIGETLDSIVSQVKEGVEIVVADGASTDDTENVMRTYVERYPAIRYYRLPVKGGVDRDYCHAVSFAAGDYCWLLTDDDIVKPGAIDTILELLPRQYSLIVVNAEIWDRSLMKRQEHKRLHLDADTFYEPSARELLFIETASYLSFIGGVIINRTLWNERLKEPYIGTEFIHVGVIFQKDLPSGAFALAEPCIMIRSGNAQWSPRHFSIWMIKWPDLLWSFPDISESAKARVSPRNPWEDSLTLVLERAFGAYSLVEYKAYLKMRPTKRWRRAVAKMIALVPGVIINLLVVLYYTVTRFSDIFLWHNLKSSRYYYRRYLARITLFGKKTVTS